MENKDQSAFPVLTKPSNYGGELYNSEVGLTKREYFAGLAMQGFLTNRSSAINIKQLAESSIECADELLKQLSQTTK